MLRPSGSRCRTKTHGVLRMQDLPTSAGNREVRNRTSGAKREARARASNRISASARQRAATTSVREKRWAACHVIDSKGFRAIGARPST